MSSSQNAASLADWRQELPVLIGPGVSLREPVIEDLPALLALLSSADASRFGVEGAINESTVLALVERGIRDRTTGFGFMYVITLAVAPAVVGLIQVRQLDPGWEAAEWEITLTPAGRGTGVFIETTRLVGSFVFGTLGTHRLEARVLQHNGRASGALKKLGAVQEGILRRSLRQGDQYLDQILWSILKEEWSEQWLDVAPRVH